jgi:hypothetical protein
LATITSDPSAARKRETDTFGAGGAGGCGWLLAGVPAAVRGVPVAVPGLLASGLDWAVGVVELQAASVSTAAIPIARRTRLMWFSVPERIERVLVTAAVAGGSAGPS